MGPIGLFALLAGLLILPMMTNDDDTAETPQDPVEPDPPVAPEPEVDPVPVVDPEPEPEIDPEPEITGDIGATFFVNGADVDIELGEDETRSLAVVYYEDTEDASEFFEVVEARFYLVPEETDWSTASWETQSDIPGIENFEGNRYNYQLADFEAENGLELVGTVDLRNLEPVASAITPPESGGYSFSSADIIAAAPEALTINANAPVAGYHLTANTDGDDLVTFLPEDFIITRNGVPQTVVTTDTDGTENDDWFLAGADNITINGGNGSDFLESTGNGVTLNGNFGNDVVNSQGHNATVNGGRGDDRIDLISGSADGGNGDDRITIADTGRASGGEGDDSLNSYSEGLTILYGDAGNDNIGAWGTGSEGYGGTGDDFIAVDNGATGFGEAGDDYLQLDSGTTGFGGAGDDLLTVWNFFDDEAGPATVTGGEGADTIDVRARGVIRGEADDLYLRVTDFNPAEDVLQVGAWDPDNPVINVSLLEAPDGSFTDVRVTHRGPYDVPNGTAVIRLDGVTGMTADQVIITN